MQASSEDARPTEPQAEIRLLRETLLGGRGPGATPGEVRAHTRWRTEVAGSPVPDLLERTAQQAARLRGDAVPPALERRPGRTSERPSLLRVILVAVLVLALRRVFGRRAAHRRRRQIPARVA